MNNHRMFFMMTTERSEVWQLSQNAKHFIILGFFNGLLRLPQAGLVGDHKTTLDCS